MNRPPINSWDQRLAAPMCAAAFVFLALLGASAEWLRWGEGTPTPLFGALGVVYALFVLELLVHLVRRDPHWPRRLAACLIPPLRLCTRDPQSPQWVWIPGQGWVARNARLAVQLERAFSLPMIGMALLILPLLAIEHYWADALAGNTLLRTLTALGTVAVWLAFAVEFFVMIAVVDNKLQYCKQHWIDIVVIVLPFVAFLRFLRLGQVLRLQQLSQLARAYRLRGVTMRLWRSILLLDLLARLARSNPEKQLQKLRQMIAEKETELELLRERVRELEAEIAAGESPALSLSEAGE